VDCVYKIDLIVESRLVLEIKSVDMLLPIHEAQLLTYLKLSGIKTGLLINFCTPLLKDVSRDLFDNHTNVSLSAVLCDLPALRALLFRLLPSRSSPACFSVSL
jgi:hypothetical protein